VKKQIQYITDAVVKSYAILFFSQNRVLGLLLLIASFMNPIAGLSGLLCCLLAIAVSSVLGYNRYEIAIGFYSFNSLLLGIGAGTFFHINVAFIIWLLITAIAAAMLSAIISSFFSKYNLPILSLPFVITFWLLLLAGNSIYHMGLMQRNSVILNELYTSAQQTKSHPAWLYIPFYPALFFRSLSAVLFQNNIISGIIIAIGLLIHSRINFSLLLIAFISAIFFNSLMETYPDGIGYYHLGANIMLASGAIGCFFFIPSGRSYVVAIIVIPLIFLFINAFTRIFGQFDLPVFSLPFCIVTLLLLLGFRYQSRSFLEYTPYQHYSPERNFYQFVNNKERLDNLKYFHLGLPFLGTWHISQSYKGNLTHKGEWAHAIDFVLRDEKGNVCKFPGNQPEDFYSYAKPVLACANGVVANVTDHLDDNEVGKVDLINNWGNSIVIKHLEGLYSQVSHLKKNSAKVKPGDIVKAGDLIALCGNSGRSPEPHLHFQLQGNPYIGSKTMSYPFAYYLEHQEGHTLLSSFEIPVEGADISPVEISSALKQAFNFPPGFTFQLSVPGEDTEDFEVFTDALNQTYIYSKTIGTTAYFINNETSFYFTSFYGSRRSLLFYFYLAAFKVIFIESPGIITKDSYPLQIKHGLAALWLQDFFAPFWQFINLNYEGFCKSDGRNIILQSKQVQHVFGKDKTTMTATVYIQENAIQGLNLIVNNIKIDIEWTAGTIC